MHKLIMHTFKSSLALLMLTNSLRFFYDVALLCSYLCFHLASGVIMDMVSPANYTQWGVNIVFLLFASCGSFFSNFLILISKICYYIVNITWLLAFAGYKKRT